MIGTEVGSVSATAASGRPSGRGSSWIFCGAYLIALGAAGVAAAGRQAAIALVVYGVIALVLLGHSAVAAGTEDARRPEAWLLAGLSIIPIAAVGQAAVALEPVPVLARPALVAFVVVAGVAAFSVGAEVPARELGLRLGRWRGQVGIALTGIPLGFAAFALAGGGPFGPIAQATAAPLAAAVVVASAGAVEELYFRGLLTRAFTRLFGRVGLVWGSVAFALPAVATGSYGLVAVLLLAGVVWGGAYETTGSVLGTAVAHALAAAGAIVVWPAVLS